MSISPRSTIYNADTKTLGVDVNAFNRFTTQGTYKVKAVISGGSRPFAMYWDLDLCYTDDYCTNWFTQASGSDLDSINVFVPSDTKWLRVYVTVGDASSETWTGYATKIIIGPASFGPASFDTCAPDVPTFGGEIWYPFFTAVPPYPNDQTGDYYIDVCSHAPVWKPK